MDECPPPWSWECGWGLTLLTLPSFTTFARSRGDLDARLGLHVVGLGIVR